jgi:hypothetical protein
MCYCPPNATGVVRVNISKFNTPAKSRGPAWSGSASNGWISVGINVLLCINECSTMRPGNMLLLARTVEMLGTVLPAW